MEYRKEIDGLRALSILGVVLYHLDLPVFSNGFMGVDVFFVISGYLIASGVLSELDIATFSVKKFFERRIRRLLPVLTAFLLLTCALFTPLLSIRSFLDFCWSVLSGVFFSANWFYARTQGYFDVPYEGRPLLHLWSLSVEEQFYLLFPFLALACQSFRKRDQRRISLLISIGFLLSASYGYASYLVTKDSSSLGFFSSFARVWEILAGVILAFLNMEGKLPPRLITTVRTVGLVGVCASITSVTGRASPFPAKYALTPVLFSCLLIAFPASDIITKLLSVRWLTYIGRLSYSLYLWHWPITVLLKKLPLFSVFTQNLIIIIATFCLSVLSFHFIETPWRRKRWRRSPFFLLGAVVSAILIFSSIGIFSRGLPVRLDETARRYADAEFDKNPMQKKCFAVIQTILDETLCDIGDKTKEKVDFIILGDSHTDALMPLLDAVATKLGLHGKLAYNSCPPLFNIENVYTEIHYCTPYMEKIERYVLAHNIKRVVLISAWNIYIKGLPREKTKLFRGPPLRAYDKRFEITENATNLFAERARTSAIRWKNNGVNVVVFGQIPAQERNVPETLALAYQAGLTEIHGIPMERHLEYQKDTVNVWKSLAIGDFVSFYDPTSILCDRYCQILWNGHALYFDDSHLSVAGSWVLESLVEEALSRIMLEA